MLGIHVLAVSIKVLSSSLSTWSVSELATAGTAQNFGILYGKERKVVPDILWQQVVPHVSFDASLRNFPLHLSCNMLALCARTSAGAQPFAFAAV